MSYSEWADFMYFVTGDSVMYLNNTYVALQSNINVLPTSLAPDWAIVPPTTPYEYPTYSTGNAVTKTITAGGTQQSFQSFTLPYTFGTDSPRTLIQIYFYGSVVMTTTGGNDLLVISGNVLDSSNVVVAPSPVSPFSVYVDSLNKPTGCDGVLMFEVALLAGSDTLKINLEAKSAIAADAYVMTMVKPVGIIQRTR